LRHRPIESLPARARLDSLKASDTWSEAHIGYQLSFPGRELSIYFESQSPYRILGWEEAYDNGLRTKARRKAVIRSKYWNKNSPQDRAIRKELKLSTE
jgi:hypothetical protein